MRRVAYLFVPDVYVIGLKGHLITGQAAYIFVTDEEYAEKIFVTKGAVNAPLLFFFVCFCFLPSAFCACFAVVATTSAQFDNSRKNALPPHTAAVLKGGLPPHSAFGKNKAFGRVVLRNSFPAALRKQSGALLRYYFALK